MVRPDPVVPPAVPKKSGFAIRSWADIGVLVLLITFIIAGLTWGMKLESRYDKLDQAYIELARQVGNGILPRAEERIRNIESQLTDIEDDIDRLDSRMIDHGINGSTHKN